jgi:hypothetical protein
MVHQYPEGDHQSNLIAQGCNGQPGETRLVHASCHRRKDRPAREPELCNLKRPWGLLDPYAMMNRTFGGGNADTALGIYLAKRHPASPVTSRSVYASGRTRPWARRRAGRPSTSRLSAMCRRVMRLGSAVTASLTASSMLRRSQRIGISCPLRPSGPCAITRHCPHLP